MPLSLIENEYLTCHHVKPSVSYQIFVPNQSSIELHVLLSAVIGEKLNIPSAEEFAKLEEISFTYEACYESYIMRRLDDKLIYKFSTIDLTRFVTIRERARIKSIKVIIKYYPEYMQVIDWLESQKGYQDLKFLGKITDYLSDHSQKLIDELVVHLTYFYLYETTPLPNDLAKRKKRLDKLQRHDWLEADHSIAEELEQRMTKYAEQAIKDYKFNKTMQGLLDLQQLYRQHNIVLNKHVDILNSTATKKLLERVGLYQSLDYEYFEFLAELGKMISWYLNGTYVKKATIANKQLDRLIKALYQLHEEVDSMIELFELYPNNFERFALPREDYRWRSPVSIQYFEHLKQDLGIIGKRKDSSLSDRLIIIDLMRVYKKIYGKDIEKRYIQKFTEIPFFKHIIEAKTIDRIVKAEKERERNEIDFSFYDLPIG